MATGAYSCGNTTTTSNAATGRSLAVQPVEPVALASRCPVFLAELGGQLHLLPRQDAPIAPAVLQLQFNDLVTKILWYVQADPPSVCLVGEPLPIGNQCRTGGNGGAETRLSGTSNRPVELLTS